MTEPIREALPGRAALANYRIRVAGVLGGEWSERTYGMTVAVHRWELEGSVTELSGELPDEAALMGVLDTLYNHGVRLLSVERLDKVDSTIANAVDSR